MLIGQSPPGGKSTGAAEERARGNVVGRPALGEPSRAGVCFSLHGDNKERSHEALKDIMICHPVHSSSEQREKVKATLCCSARE